MLHMTVVLHITVVWFQVCLKEDMQKNIFGSNMPQKKTRLHRPRPPFKLSTSGDVKKRLKAVPPATQVSLGKSCNMQVKNKNVCLVLVVPCDMQNSQTCSGVLSSSTNCGQNGLCQFFVVRTGCCPVDTIHPCMFLTLAPTKTFCEQVAKPS